jgi:hypothetical protein
MALFPGKNDFLRGDLLGYDSNDTHFLKIVIMGNSRKPLKLPAF